MINFSKINRLWPLMLNPAGWLARCIPVFLMVFMTLITLSGCQKMMDKLETAPFMGDTVTVSVTVPEELPRSSKPVDYVGEAAPELARPVRIHLDERLLPVDLPDQSASLSKILSQGPADEAVRPVRPLREQADTVLAAGNITEDLTLHGTVLVRGTLTIEPQTTLWVEPGTEIRFVPEKSSGELPKLVVQGRIVVKGTDGQPVSFLPGQNDPLAGDWGGIVLLDSSKNNILEHCRIIGTHIGLDLYSSRFSGRNISFSRCHTGLALHDSDVSVDQLQVSRCNSGITLDDSEFELNQANLNENRLGLLADNSFFSLNSLRSYGNSQEGGIIRGGRFKIENSRFEQSRTGLKIFNSEGQIAGSQFKNNREDGAVLEESVIKISSSGFTQNRASGLVVNNVKGGIIGSSLTNNTLFNLENRSTEPFNAQLNWWGSDDEQEIIKWIGWVQDNTYTRLVPFVPFMTEEPQFSSH